MRAVSALGCRARYAARTSLTSSADADPAVLRHGNTRSAVTTVPLSVEGPDRFSLGEGGRHHFGGSGLLVGDEGHGPAVPQPGPTAAKAQLNAEAEAHD